MLHKYCAIALALFGLTMQNASAGNEQAQRLILGGASVEGPALPAPLTYKVNSQDQGRALLAPDFVSGGYVGASATVDIDGHEQARRMIVGE